MQIYFLIFIIIAIKAKRINYEGYKVYEVVPKTTDQVKIVEELNALGSFWDEYVGINFVSKIWVPRKKQSEFLSRLAKAHIEVKEIVSDLQRVIDKTFETAPPTFRSKERFYSMTWDKYYNHYAINTWLDTLAEKYPKKVKTVVLGYTFEMREVKAIVIKRQNKFQQNRKNKVIGVVEAGIHAREWISSATATWIIKEFLTSKDTKIKSLAQRFEWHVIPVANPDGYAFTFSDDPLWRKNRNPTNNKTCLTRFYERHKDPAVGVDLNRNFGIEWCSTSIDKVTEPCTDVFAGAFAYSEAETRAITKYLMKIKNTGKIIYYITLHSMTQMALLPYGYLTVPIDDKQRPANYDKMYKVAVNSVEKLKQRYGTVYQVGMPAELLYAASGSSLDWAIKVLNVNFVCTLELRDKKTFLLPPEQIIPNCEEVMDFFVEMDRSARSYGLYIPLQRLFGKQNFTSLLASTVSNSFFCLVACLLVLNVLIHII